MRSSTARLSTGQRTALNDVEDARLEQRPEGPYWIFEHISQVSVPGALEGLGLRARLAGPSWWVLEGLGLRAMPAGPSWWALEGLGFRAMPAGPSWWALLDI